jgi:L-threonylcarbamoyladenylate synthase
MNSQIGKDLEKAIRILNSGGLVAIPTETVYGLAANALDENAVTGIFKAKNRPFFDPLICHLAEVKDIERYVLDFPAPLRSFMEIYSPGPLTIILPKTDEIPYITTGGLDTAAFRIPRHPITQELLQALDFPLAAPSPNPFGYISPTTAQHVKDQLEGEVDYILDGGPCSVGIESTIIEYSEGTVIVHRLGGLSLEELKQHFESLEVREISSSNPQAPGQLSSHYAPSKTLLLGEIKALFKNFEGSNPAIIRFQSEIDGIDSRRQFVLSGKGSTEEAARKIFGLLRELDNSDFGLILAEYLPETGLGPAINDRLRRASFKD